MDGIFRNIAFEYVGRDLRLGTDLLPTRYWPRTNPVSIVELIFKF